MTARSVSLICGRYSVHKLAMATLLSAFESYGGVAYKMDHPSLVSNCTLHRALCLKKIQVPAGC